jgi:hypothetical protein
VVCAKLRLETNKKPAAVQVNRKRCFIIESLFLRDC